MSLNIWEGGIVIGVRHIINFRYAYVTILIAKDEKYMNYYAVNGAIERKPWFRT